MSASDKKARVDGCLPSQEPFVAARTCRAQSTEDQHHRQSVLLWCGAVGCNWWSGTSATGLTTHGVC